MTNTNPRDDMAKLSLYLRDCVDKADGNWAYVNIDVLLDAAEYLERFAQPELTLTVQDCNDMPKHGENFIAEDRPGEIVLDGSFTREDLIEIANTVPTTEV